MDSFTLSVQRSAKGGETGGDGDGGHYEAGFSVPVIAESMSVLDAMLWVRSNQDSSLAFRCACRVGMCGTCGVRINGRERLACKTLVSTVLESGNGTISVEPLRHLPVVRDLVTDPGDFNKRLTESMPRFMPISLDQAPAAIAPDSAERRAINPHRECIYCGLCYSACSMAGEDKGFLGPAAFNRAFSLVSDSRDGARSQRLDAVDGGKGIWSCHTIFECTAVCPKGIPITLAIQGLKRKLFVKKIKALFRLGRR
ncbi:MAG: 2Fe-2S iron-sulfur cluster-binding protein [Dehalococcoidia bacterium]